MKALLALALTAAVIGGAACSGNDYEPSGTGSRCATLQEAWWDTPAGSDAEADAADDLEAAGCDVPEIDGTDQDLAMESAWDAMSASDHADMCAAINLVGAETMLDLAGIDDGSLDPDAAAAFLEEKC